MNALGNVPEIVVRINSGGGDVFAANAIYKMTHWAGLDEEDAFEDQYGAKIDRLQEKIDDATWVESDNPADQIKAYEKALELCDQLEDFCAECGPYGSTYFLNHCAGIT